MARRMNALSDRALTLASALLLCLAMLGSAAAQETPQGKAEERKVPIPYVPSPQFVVDRMLDLARVGPGDFVIDLGSGDGRIPVTAARRGARGFGVDIDSDLVERATGNAQKAGVTDRVSFRVQDLFETPLREATVLSLYLPVAVNVKLRPRMLDELRPGTRIVAHQFGLGDWDADFSETLNHRTIYLWLVPAKVEGTWEVTHGDRTFNLHLSQIYQKLIGTASMPPTRASAPAPAGAGAGAPATVPPRRYFTASELLLRGADLNFVVTFEGGDRRMFYGRVDGDRIVPRTAQGSEAQEIARGWQAVRISEKPLPDGEASEDDWYHLQ